MSDIVVYGRGKTGKSIMKMLQKQGNCAEFYDDVTGFDNEGKFTENTLVITSPGVPRYAQGLQTARAAGARIVGELEYCFPLCKGKCISVTGTNGKTTTCEMIFKILRDSGKTCSLLGNGGVPFSSRVLDVASNELVVLESSSFQLDGCSNFAPYVSVFTNLAPDHLNYHGSYNEYVKAKCNNFINQRDGYAIFCLDSEPLLALSRKCKCRALFYSANQAADCCFVDDNRLLCCGNIVDCSPLGGLAVHNKLNAAAAILACYMVGVDPAQAVRSVKDFVPLPHRLQRVGKAGNVVFYDDSKATNVHATVAALDAFSQSNLVLLLGGSDKGENFDEIFTHLSSGVVAVIAVGQTAESIRLCGQKYHRKVTICDDFRQAAQLGYQLLAECGGTVLMSNACASFDAFCGYAERGDYFQSAVREIERGKEKV